MDIHAYNCINAQIHTHIFAHRQMYFSCVLQWSWQTLFFGTGLQFIFGLLILRTTFGLGALRWLGNKAEVYTQIYLNTQTSFFLVVCMVAFDKFADVAITAFLKQMFLLHIFDI